MASEDKLNEALLAAAVGGQDDEVESLLKRNANPAHQDEKGVNAMMLAASKGNQNIISLLLQDGAPWNALDSAGESAGEYAARNGHTQLYERLIDAAIRAELVLSKVSKPEPNFEYLSQKLRFIEDTAGKMTLLDANDDAVMMGWEGPLMDLHAQLMCKRGGDVLNVGFGLGLIDDAIQKLAAEGDMRITSHTIIEAHPDVFAKMKELGWDKKPGVKIVFGRWQDVIGNLGPFDGIFFDTFGEHYAEMETFHKYLPRILKHEGVYSFFNGLAASTNGFFHTVYCRLVELQLMHAEFSTQYVQYNMEEILGAEKWEGVRREYFTLDTYNLPIIKHMEILDLCDEVKEEDNKRQKTEQDA
jgi:protein arginine N-methyltransferase 2